MKEEIKGMKIVEEAVKLSLFSDDMKLYIKNPKYSTEKLLELINEFNEGAGYKIIPRIQLHFYMPTMNYQKGKLRKQSHSQLLQKE